MTAMIRKLCILIISLVILSGFSSISDQLKSRLAQMSHHYSQFDATIGWTVTGADSGVKIDGIFKNIRYATMENIEIWVSIFDAKGKLLARSAEYIIPTELGLDELAPFTINLKTSAPQDAKLLFTYKYVGEDGGGGDGGGTGRWMQSFESGL
jgi:hypothetical protein